MNCQRCHIKPAMMRVTQVINGIRNDLLLCHSCAQLIGVDDMSGEQTEDITQHILDTIQDYQRELEELAETSCTNCGLNIKLFHENGQLGCPRCYNEFESFLKPLIRRYHGTTRHSSPVSRKAIPRLQDHRVIILREKLNRALKSEDFETAAKLRDEIIAADKTKK